ncbi:hypothetical protein K8S19_09240 [bacterium]|nr:hypothetical protein [bacterium]
MKVDLTKYLNQILAPEDKPLFEEAIKSADCGALRAAYIMIWLSCAESLKRRFHEALKRDSEAGKIVGEIQTKESNKKAVDYYVLDHANKYGFVDDASFLVLEHIYNMRCIFGHPYEKAPSPEQVKHAASSVVEYVLSRPVKLNKGFAQKLIKDMLGDPDYIDDLRKTVEDFTKEISVRIDEGTYKWLLTKYWKELEKDSYDSSFGKQFRRGVWFSQTLLTIGCVGDFKKDEWHAIVRKYPKTCMGIFCDWELFSEIGRDAQDYIVGYLIGHCEEQPKYLNVLEHLQDRSCLSSRQKERYSKCLDENAIETVRAGNLRLVTCFEAVIDALKSHNFYIQNSAIDIIVQNGWEGMNDLKLEQQIELGRNVLQAADGGAARAYQLIDQIFAEKMEWPENFIKGIFFECFINENDQLRLKERRLEDVLEILGILKPASRNAMISELIRNVEKGTLKYADYDKQDLKKGKKIITKYKWLEKLWKSINIKVGGGK